jgi:hypothetical protein
MACINAEVVMGLRGCGRRSMISCNGRECCIVCFFNRGRI